jgi:hypothetical protein
MSNIEEQAMELEALESLFPTELQRKSETEFSLVGLVPFSDNSEVNHVSVDLFFSYPPGYPSEQSVDVSITKSSGCIATDSSRLEDLESTIQITCQENIGCSVVYQIAERVQEWLRENNEEEKSLHDMLLSKSASQKVASRKKTAVLSQEDSEDYDSELDSDYSDSDYEDDSEYTSEDEEESDEDEEFEGLQLKNLCSEDERVTMDQFLEWKNEYDAYLLKEGLIKRIAPDDTRQTGKQQFLQLLTQRRQENTTEQEFNEELFGNEEDIDVEDLDDEA